MERRAAFWQRRAQVLKGRMREDNEMWADELLEQQKMMDELWRRLNSSKMRREKTACGA